MGIPMFFCERIKEFKLIGLEMGRGDFFWWIYLVYELGLTDHV